MGCGLSKKQYKEGLFNEDSDVRRKLLTGIQMSKSPEGIEGNFQLAFGKTKRKRYEKWQALRLSGNNQNLKENNQNLKKSKTVRNFLKGVFTFRKIYIYIFFGKLISFAPQRVPA